MTARRDDRTALATDDNRCDTFNDAGFQYKSYALVKGTLLLKLPRLLDAFLFQARAKIEEPSATHIPSCESLKTP